MRMHVEEMLEIMRCWRCHEYIKGGEGEQHPPSPDDGVRPSVENGLITLQCSGCSRNYIFSDGVFSEEISDDVSGLEDKDLDRLSAERLGFTPCPKERRAEQEKLIDRLDLFEDSKVLDVSPDTSRNLSSISRYLTDEGRVVGVGPSAETFGVARMIRDDLGVPVGFVQGQPESLPFNDNTFNAVLYVGELSTRLERVKILKELVRVAIPQAKIVVAEEGLPPLLRKALGKPQLCEAPPVGAVPGGELKSFELDWGDAELFYIFEMTKKGASTTLSR